MIIDRKTLRKRVVWLVLTLFLIPILVMAIPVRVRALDSGWKNANYYYNVSHVYDVNDVYTQDGYEARFGEYDDYTGSAYFSFGSSFVPANAYITGIEVRIDCFNPYRTTILYVNLYDNGTFRGGKSVYAPRGESNNYVYAGSAYDNWGYSGWTPAAINTTNFRIQLSNFDDDDPVYVDHLQVKIHYTIGHVVTSVPADVTAHSATIAGFYDSFLEPNHANQKGLEFWDTANSVVTSYLEPVTEDSGTMRADLTGILSNTRYACRAGVWYDASPGDLNLDDNITYGGTYEFTTPPDVTTLSATSVTSRDVVLNGLTNPEGSRAVSNGFYISNTADTVSELKVLALQLGNPGEGSFSKAISGLQPNTTYYYLAASYNLANGVLNFGFGEVLSFTTLPDPPVLTAHPVNRTITYGANTSFSASASGIPLADAAWQVSTDAGTTWGPAEGGIYSVSTTSNAETGVVSTTLSLTNPPVAVSGNRYRAVFTNWVVPSGVASNSASLTVNRANATISVNGWSGVYDSTPHGASLGTATGVGGEDLAGSVTIGSATYTNVPGGTVSWSFSHPNYNPQSGNASIAITPADATISVNGWSGVYDSTPHGATLGTATGVGGEDLTASVSIDSTPYTNVPGGAVSWSFNDLNYWPQSGRVDIVIEPAEVTIIVNGWSGVYDGLPHGATLVSATGIDSQDLSAFVAVSTMTFIDAPGGSVPWSFSHLNYRTQSGQASVTISKASLTVTALDRTSQYSDQLQELLFELKGFIGSEDAGVVTGLPVLNTTAVPTSQSGTYPITVDVSGMDAINYCFVPVDGTYTITKEDLSVFYDITLTSQLVATPGGTAPYFELVVELKETRPDGPAGSALAGDIHNAVLGTMRMTLTPVGPGGSYVSGVVHHRWNGLDDYDGILYALCGFVDGIPVNTYEVQFELTDNPYYQLGSNTSVFTVYDPSLGFTTGGGWFYWPGTADASTGYPGDKTNFGYTMSYGKKMSNLKGSLLTIRHMANGDIYRIKSNALDAGSLALGTTELPMGWATFSGKCTATAIESGIETTVGNIPFRVYVEDRNEPGILDDRFWVGTSGFSYLTMAEPCIDEAVCIRGGNVFVPHEPAKK